MLQTQSHYCLTLSLLPKVGQNMKKNYKDDFSWVSYKKDIKGKHFLCFVILSSKYSAQASIFFYFLFFFFFALAHAGSKGFITLGETLPVKIRRLKRIVSLWEMNQILLPWQPASLIDI